MTIQELMNAAKEARSHSLSDTTILREINITEGKIQEELLGITESQKYKSGDEAAEMLLISPHEDIYLYTLMSRIDYLLSETNLYQNDKELAEEEWNDLMLRICRHGRRAAFGEIMLLNKGEDAAISFDALGLADGDISSISVTFTERGATAFTKTEEDATYEGGTLTVPLTAADTALLHTGITTVQAELVSADEETTVKSRKIRAWVMER